MSGENPFAVAEAPPQRDGRGAPEAAPPNLLELEEADAVKRLLEEWQGSHKGVRPLLEQWKVNVARAKGYTGVKLIKQQDESRAYIPLTATPSIAAMNEAARLRRRMRAILFADPPLLEATPSTDEDEDRDAAEFATRVLQDVASEGNLSYATKSADAFDCGSDYGSGFIRFWVDPAGGGWAPREIMASPAPQATAEHPLRDPATGQPWAAHDGSYPQPVRRYVTTDGLLTDTRADPDVAKQWLPKLRDEELDGRHVRLIPSTARDVWDADGLMIGAMVPLGVVKSAFPKVAQMDERALQQLIQSRPEHFKDLMPRGRTDPGAKITDEALVFVLSRYHRQSVTYPYGAYLCAAGEDVLLHRGPWWDRTNAEPLDLPVTQFAHFREKDNPYSQGLMELLGPGQELRAYVFGYVLEHLERLSSRKTFVPLTATYTPEQLQSPTATVIPTMPGQEPHYEELPDLPTVVAQLLEATKQDLKDESGLQDPISGQNPSNVSSGLHAQTIIEQVVQSLSELKQNAERGFVRGGRIILQLIRANYTTPQKVKWVGDDGAFKQEEFTGADLGTTKDVRLNKGSFTALAPSAKAALAQNLFLLRDPTTGEGILSTEDVRSIVAGNVGGLLGVQDNPHLLRVKRQVSQWRQGPPKGWAPPAPTVDPATGQPVQAPDPVVAGIFTPTPADEEPSVAKLRAYELGRALASTRFATEPEWRAPLEQEYLRMRQAAGMQTVAEQQQAAQAQQDAAAQAQEQQTGALLEQQAQTMEQEKAQIVQALDALKQALAETQAQLDALTKQAAPAISGAVEPVQAAVTAIQGDVQTLAKAQQEVTADMVRIAQNVDAALTTGKETLLAQLATERKDLEERLLRLAETLKPGPMPPITVTLPSPRGMKVVRDKKGLVQGTEPREPD